MNAANWRTARPADMAETPDLADDDWEPVLYTESQLDSILARALTKLSVGWFIACGIVVYVALTGVRP
jgi:hypothetical protein